MALVSQNGGISFSVEGLPALQDLLETRFGDITQELYEVVVEELYAIKERSQILVPYRTGFLHNSAYVEVTVTDDEVEGTVGYTAPYAVFVHENPDIWHRPPTQWKYLETPWLERRGGVIKKIKAEVTKMVRGK